MDLVKEIEPGNIFAGKTKKEVLRGNAFSIQHPMMDYKTFEKDPTLLVGKEKSAFTSRSNDGTTPARRSDLPDNSGKSN